MDYTTAGLLVDDVSDSAPVLSPDANTRIKELHSLLVKPLPMGCRLTVIFDVRHGPTRLLIRHQRTDCPQS